MWSILIIDDERNFCAILEDYIARDEKRFYVRKCFTDGQLAWNWLEKNAVDLIITDIRMPNMTGLDLAQRLFETERDIPLIVISGYSDFDYAKRAIQYGVVNYLLKPVDFTELGETLSRLDEQLSVRRSAPGEDSQIVLFLFYAMAGLLSAKENLAHAANRARVPFNIETDRFRLFEAGACATPDRMEKENLAQVLENLLRMRYPGAAVYRVYETAEHFYFLVIGGCAAQKDEARAEYEMLRRESGFVPRFSLQAESEGMAALCRAVWQSGLRDTFLSSISQSEITCNPLSGDASDSDRMQRKRLIFEQAAAYMREHTHEDPSREDVARAAFVSQSYLSHVFSDIAGMSFVEYLTKIRMEKAVAMLATGKRINEISEAVGYRSRKAFLANFRAFTGLTPSEYRLKYYIGGDNDE